ncbi:hypothetical protein Ancab_035731 [Ancistrocladus abbreviatus]
MGSLIHKLLKKTYPFRIVSSFSNHVLPKPTPIITSNQLIIGQDKTEHSTFPLPVLDSIAGCNSWKPSESIPIFPNSPFGFFLNPIYPTRFDRLVVEEVEQVQSDARKIWADSVKKKRKKKMNKHKYKKLRKRLRRKT